MRYIWLLLFCALLAFAPVWGGRSFNGTSDYITGAGIVTAGTRFTEPPANVQATGTLSFMLNIGSLPTGTTLAYLVGFGGSHCINTSCATTNSSCGSQVGRVCNFVWLQPGTPNLIVDELVNPGTGEAITWWTVPSSGVNHNVVFLINRTAASMQFYLDGALQTQQGSSQNSDPGGGNNFGNGPVTIGAALLTSGTCCLSNAVISDVAYWNLTLTANEIKSLANCVPPNRIESQVSAYWPLYGVDSPEPEYVKPDVSASLAPRSLTITSGTTRNNLQSGCQPGGAYAP